MTSECMASLPSAGATLHLDFGGIWETRERRSRRERDFYDRRIDPPFLASLGGFWREILASPLTGADAHSEGVKRKLPGVAISTWRRTGANDADHHGNRPISK